MAKHTIRLVLATWVALVQLVSVQAGGGDVVMDELTLAQESIVRQGPPGTGKTIAATLLGNVELLTDPAQ